MLKSHSISLTVATCAVIAIFTGCYGRPKAVKIPKIDPISTAEEIFSKYDNNSNGQLSPEELLNCPSLLSAMSLYDNNRDRRIEKDELIQRFSMWADSTIGVSTLACRVSAKGRPLAGAQVELVPEEFFENVIQPAVGTTRKSGVAALAIDSSFLPEDMKTFRGVQQGLYKVVITHPNIDIPAKYNSSTTLGIEVSFETGKTFVNFKL